MTVTTLKLAAYHDKKFIGKNIFVKKREKKI